VAKPPRAAPGLAARGGTSIAWGIRLCRRSVLLLSARLKGVDAAAAQMRAPLADLRDKVAASRMGHPPPSPPCARGSSRERLPPRLASFSSSWSTPHSANDASLAIPSAPLCQAVQATSTPVRACCATASVPPRPHSVPPALLLTPCSASATHHAATDEAVRVCQVATDPIHPLLQLKRAAGHEETRSSMLFHPPSSPSPGPAFYGRPMGKPPPRQPPPHTGAPHQPL
jgi:hypothetical protein